LAARTPEENFLNVVRSTELWLDRVAEERAASRAVSDLAQALRRYLSHCRRHLRTGDWSAKEMERRRRRINKAILLILERQSQRD